MNTREFVSNHSSLSDDAIADRYVEELAVQACAECAGGQWFKELKKLAIAGKTANIYGMRRRDAKVIEADNTERSVERSDDAGKRQPIEKVGAYQVQASSGPSAEATTALVLRGVATPRIKPLPPRAYQKMVSRVANEIHASLESYATIFVLNLTQALLDTQVALGKGRRKAMSNVTVAQHDLIARREDSKTQALRDKVALHKAAARLLRQKGARTLGELVTRDHKRRYEVDVAQ